MEILLYIIFLLQVIQIQSEVINEPTLKPAQPFSATDDAETIRKDMIRGTAGLDDMAHILFHRTYDQRRQIEEYYNQKFCQTEHGDQCPLHSALKYRSTVSLDKLYNILLMPLEGILAQTVKNSIKNGDGEVGAIEEVICANDKQMKDRINQYYNTTYGLPVEDHLATFRKEDPAYQTVMQKYCWKGLCQEAKITPQNVDKEATALKDLHHKKDKVGFKKKLNDLLDTTCEPDLRQIFKKYRHHKKGIGEAVDDLVDDDRLRRAYHILVSYIENVCKFYAHELYDTINSAMSVVISVHKINRIVLSRCERDLLCILKAYHDKHHITFTNHMKQTFEIRRYYYLVPTEYRYIKTIRYLCGKP